MTSECLSVTSAWIQLETLWSACVDTCFAGRACTSGWRRGPAARCAPCARPPSAATRSSRSTAAGTPSRRTPGIRCLLGPRGNARSPRTTAASRVSASATASTCPSASAPSPSASSRLPSTSATRGLVQHRAARRSTRRSSSCRRYSCGWPSYSCCGWCSHDRPPSTWRPSDTDPSGHSLTLMPTRTSVSHDTLYETMLIGQCISANLFSLEDL